MFSEQERYSLLNRGDVRGRAQCWLAYMYALRTHELQALAWPHISFDGARIYITRGKRGISAWHPQPAPLAALLYEDSGAERADGRGPDFSRYVFTGEDPDRPASRWTILREFDRHAASLEIAWPRHVYSPWRRDLAESMDNRNASLTEIKDALGHKSVTSTSHYLRGPAFRKAAVNQLAFEYVPVDFFTEEAPPAKRTPAGRKRILSLPPAPTTPADLFQVALTTEHN